MGALLGFVLHHTPWQPIMVVAGIAGPAALAFFRFIPWRLAGAVIALVALLALHFFLQDQAVNVGILKERHAWQANAEHVRIEVREVAHNIVTQHTVYVERLDHSLEAAHEQIQNASHEDDATFFDAWASADLGLCNAGGGCPG